MGQSAAINPLTTEHHKMIQQLLKECRETLTFCQQVGNCGIDVSKEAALTQEQIELLEKIYATFGPKKLKGSG